MLLQGIVFLVDLVCGHEHRVLDMWRHHHDHRRDLQDAWEDAVLLGFLELLFPLRHHDHLVHAREPARIQLIAMVVYCLRSRLVVLVPLQLPPRSQSADPRGFQEKLGLAFRLEDENREELRALLRQHKAFGAFRVQLCRAYPSHPA